MVTKTITEQRAKYVFLPVMIPAHTATGSSGISSATPALTPLMLDGATGKLVVWDGQKAGSAVGILVLPLEGTEEVLTYYKSGPLRRRQSAGLKVWMNTKGQRLYRQCPESRGAAVTRYQATALA
ncbi:phage head decoration protein [Escherichia coli]|nr:phage head decoration protein [Escherichia coli]